MNQRVGTCSLCGGDVYGFRGAWLGTYPPPPDKCTVCGAVAKRDIIEMAHPAYKTEITTIYETRKDPQ